MDKTAQEVLDLVRRGEYLTGSGKKTFHTEQVYAEKSTKNYSPQIGKNMLDNEICSYMGDGISIYVTEETTQAAAHRLIVKEKKRNVVLLNFASARNPGGGFLKGSKAQEEDLCRCSGLFNCLTKLSTTTEYYTYNRTRSSPLYSDNTLYSPNVPWFRKDSHEKPNDLFLASVITSPAPNASRLNRQKNAKEIETSLRQRAGIILAIAQANKHRDLILGAWGCGVFKNSPSMVADAFGEWLSSTRFAFVFDSVTFAIYCPGKDKSTYKAFQERF